MPEHSLVARINQAKGGRVWAEDIEKIKELASAKHRLIELRSLFRYRLHVPQVEYREQYPDTLYTEAFFTELLAKVRRWYDEVKDAFDKKEIDLADLVFPTFEALLAEADAGGIATSMPNQTWFMRGRSEPKQVVKGLVR